MALIKCPECGKEVSDRAYVCINCGYDLKADDELMEMEDVEEVVEKFNNSKKSKKKSSIKLCKHCKSKMPKNAKVCPTCRKKQGSGCFTTLIVVILFVAFVVIAPSVSKQVNSNHDTPTMLKEDFIAACQEVSYEVLARSPKSYVGKYVKMEVQVLQNLNYYYRVYTLDDLGFAQYEFAMIDGRYDKSMKILDEDKMIVYGEFTGTRSVTRALTGVSEDVPAFKARYIELTN